MKKICFLCSCLWYYVCFFFFFQAEDGIRDVAVTGVQTCALPISDGRRLERSTTLVFTEPHRVTALNPGVYRVVEEVVEGDAPRSVTREWRLAAGEALTLRPGDRLILEAGAPGRLPGRKRAPGRAAPGGARGGPPA